MKRWKKGRGGGRRRRRRDRELVDVESRRKLGLLGGLVLALVNLLVVRVMLLAVCLLPGLALPPGRTLLGGGGAGGWHERVEVGVEGGEVRHEGGGHVKGRHVHGRHHAQLLLHHRVLGHVRGRHHELRHEHLCVHHGRR